MSSSPVIRRRSVLAGAAWSAPVIAVATAAPALAASAPQLVFRFASLNNFAAGSASTMLVILGNTGSTAYPAGATFQFSVSQVNGGPISRSATLNATRTTGVAATPKMPPPQQYQSFWDITLTAPVPPLTGTTFPLSNPTFAVDIPGGTQPVHMTFGHVTASPGTSGPMGLPVGRWFDSTGTSGPGWWRPASGSTYPNNLSHLFVDF